MGDEKQRIVDRLGDAFARDLIDTDELERRVEIAENTDDPKALAQLVADLPSEVTSEAAADGALVPVEAQRALATRADTEQLLAVFSNISRNGTWTPARSTRLRTVCGTATLDLRQALLAPGVTEIQVDIVLGSVKIIVPPRLPVEVSCSAILAEVDQDERPGVGADPLSDSPRLRIVGTCVLAELEVRDRHVGEGWWAARKRRKAARRAQRALPPGSDGP